MITEEKIEALKKGLEILQQYPENLQGKAFDYLFQSDITSDQITNDKTTVLQNSTTPQTMATLTNRNSKYARVFTYDGDKVYIHKKVPGNNNATKTKNIALIVLFAKGESIYGDEIKALCEKNGCLDKNNFAGTFEGDTKNFIKKGKKGSSKWTIELTMDGQEAAEALLEEMLNANK